MAVQKITNNLSGRPTPYTGPAVLAGGYRIFFFSAAVWAVTALAVWLLFLAGLLGNFGDTTDMLQWHAHELVYGYGGAVVAGFALTAIPNWTGRAAIKGRMLALLFLPWLLARISACLLLAGYELGVLRAVAENIFYLLFLALAASEVIAGKNWRNVKIIVVFSLLVVAAVLANLARLQFFNLPFPGWQLGLSILLLLVCVIGGRIIPAFTGNWMRMQGMEEMPVMFGKFDAVCIAAAAATLALKLAEPFGTVVTAAAALTAGLHFVRMARWRGWMTKASPIVLVLHVAYLWVPIGFLLAAFASAGLLAEATAIHAWTIGGIGSTTLAVMSRASLGHAGLPLNNSTVLTSLYLAINLAAIVRVTAGIWTEHAEVLVNASGVLWCLAFLLFLVRFTPIHFAAVSKP